jgi:hypothetical protein
MGIPGLTKFKPVLLKFRILQPQVQLVLLLSFVAMVRGSLLGRRLKCKFLLRPERGQNPPD